MSNSYKGWENREFEVEKIIKERQIYKQNKINKKIEPSKEYLVKWVGYKNPTWEPTENLENCQILLNEFLMRKKKNQLKKAKINKKNDINANYCNANETKVFKLILDEEENDKNMNENNTIISQKNNLEDLENKKEDKIIEESDELNVSSIIEQLKQKDKEIKIINDEKNIVQDNFLNNNIFSESSINLSIDNYNGFDFLEGSKDIISIDPFENYLSFGGETCSKSEDKKLNDNEKNEFLKKKRNNEDEDINESKINIIEIMGLKVPNEDNGKYLLKVKYKSLKDNKIYIKEIESKSKVIPKNFLIKYYEHIFFERYRGQKFSNKLELVN